MFEGMNNVVPKPDEWTVEKSRLNFQRRVNALTLRTIVGFKTTTKRRRRYGYTTEATYLYQMQIIAVKEAKLRAA